MLMIFWFTPEDKNKYVHGEKYYKYSKHMAQQQNLLKRKWQRLHLYFWDTPLQTKMQLRQIIGLVNYYHDFILNYSKLMSPPTDLLKGGPTKKQIKCTQECQQTLIKIQNIFKTKPVLLTPNIKLSFVLATDCSAYGCGFCLKQYKGNTLHPVFYGSRKLTTTECRMSVVDRDRTSLSCHRNS